MLAWLPIFAQDPAKEQPPSWSLYLPFIVMGLMLFMFFRVSSKQKREAQQRLTLVKKNDKVVTSGGILGVVVAIKDNEDEVTLKVDDSSNTRIRVLKSSIARIISGDVAASETKP